MKTIITSILGVLLLAGCGGNTNSGAEPSAPVTHTETVTKTVTKTVTPQACRQLLRTLPIYANAVQRFGSNAEQWPPLVGKAYAAGLSLDPSQADPILSKMQTLTRDLHQQTQDLKPIMVQLRTLGRECNSH